LRRRDDSRFRARVDHPPHEEGADFGALDGEEASPDGGELCGFAKSIQPLNALVSRAHTRRLSRVLDDDHAPGVDLVAQALDSRPGVPRRSPRS